MSKVLVHVQRKIVENSMKEQPQKKDSEVKKYDKNIDKLLSNIEDNKLFKTSQNDKDKMQNVKLQQKNSQDVLQQKGKTIRQIEQFFQQRYLGPKKNTKTANFNKLLKTPLFNPQTSQTTFKMKTPNLNVKLKQIQKIFSVQKKSTTLKKKKVLVQSENLSEFQLYLTKRDVLRQKNESLQEMRKFWLEEKKKQQEKRLKKKQLKNIKKQQQPVRVSSEGKQVQQQQKKQKIKTQQKPAELQSTTQQKQKSMSLIQKMNNDEYFQKKFQQKIVKNSLSTQQKFSIRSMLQPSRNKKTTLNSLQFFKNQLDLIENVARNTIDNFHNRQKINKILYSQQTQSQQDFKSALMSKRATPIINQDLQEKDIKPIGWVLKQCQNFKKRFNIRKTKSLSNIKRNK